MPNYGGPAGHGYYPGYAKVPAGNKSPRHDNVNGTPVSGVHSTTNIINNMPVADKVDKLHGPRNVNKKTARDAFMSGAFGI